MSDPIVDEVRRIRDEHAARFDHDLDAIFRDIKARERASGLVFAHGAARQAVETSMPPSSDAEPIPAASS